MTLTPQHKAERGGAVVEVGLLAPWIFFLFASTFDVGVVNYDLIATENAARVAAEYTSQGPSTAGDKTGACTYALRELSSLLGVSGLTTCNGSPVTVTATQITGPDGALATSVSVTYQTALLIPVPGLAKQFNITRTAQMRLQSTS